VATERHYFAWAGAKKGYKVYSIWLHLSDHKTRLGILHLWNCRNNVLYNSIRTDFVSFHSGSSTRSTGKLNHKTSATNNIMNSYFYRLPRLWNNLPTIDSSRSPEELNLNWRFIYWIIFKLILIVTSLATLSLSLYPLCQDSCTMQLYLIVILYISS